MSSQAGNFHKLFARWARRVRARITARHALTGLTLGLVVGALAATAAWQLNRGELRPWMAGCGLLGIGAGVGWGLRRRWSDTDVALYLDGRLQAREAITTAVQLGSSDEVMDCASAIVVRDATQALEHADARKARPRVLRVVHAVIPLAAGALVLVARLPEPAQAMVAAAPGSDIVRLVNVEGLEKIAALGALQSPDPVQRERLKKLADDARKLQENLREGMERREAQSELARLRDAIAAERLRMGDAERRAGLEAAHGRLAQDALMRDAAKALGDRDLTRFDEEMQKLAQRREKADREAAQKALEEAAQAAQKAGAPDVAKMLEEQRKLFDERSKRGEALREFAKAFGDALPEDVRQDMQELAEGNGTDKDASKMAERMADALEKLSPEERKRLAERLSEQAGNMQLDPMTRQQMRDMSQQLDSPEGQKQLEEMLRRMANEPPASEQAERDRALGEAEKGAGQAQGQLGAPVPMPGQGNSGSGSDGTPQSGNNAGNGTPKGGQNDGQGGPGSHHDKGRGDHAGTTPKVDGDEMRARAGGTINKAAPMPGVVTGRGQGRAGESANVRGTEAIGQAGPSEIGGVERSDIPEEYRDQVGRYFSP